MCYGVPLPDSHMFSRLTVEEYLAREAIRSGHIVRQRETGSLIPTVNTLVSCVFPPAGYCEKLLLFVRWFVALKSKASITDAEAVNERQGSLESRGLLLQKIT